MMIVTGTANISLVSDSGITSKATLYDWAYVLSSPFNILPPVLLIHTLKTSGHKINMFSHDDTIYQ